MPVRKTGTLPEPIDRQVNEIIRGINVIEEQIAKLSQGLRGQGDEIGAILPITRDKLVDDVLSGLIVESGSNANGEYVRWGNGLQVCWGIVIIPANAGYIEKAMPAAFSGEFSITITNAYWHTRDIGWSVSASTGSSPIFCHLTRLISSTLRSR